MWKNLFKVIITRPVVFYLACMVAVSFVIDWPRFKKNAIDQTMNRFGPEVNYFKDFVETKGHYDTFKLRQCVRYYQRVADYYSFEREGAYAMLGFCSALLGHTNRATEAYEASAAINPNDFWVYYNLGVLAYKKGDYEKAIKHFKEALQKDVELNIFILYRSKIYTDVRLSDPTHKNYDFLAGLREGRESAYIFLMESLIKTNQYEKLLEVAMVGLKDNLKDEDIFYYYAARSFFYQKLYDKAVSFLQIAVQKNPNNADAFLYLGLCMRIVGKEDLAQEFLSIAKEISKFQGSMVEKHLGTGVRFF